MRIKKPHHKDVGKITVKDKKIYLRKEKYKSNALTVSTSDKNNQPFSISVISL